MSNCVILDERKDGVVDFDWKTKTRCATVDDRFVIVKLDVIGLETLEAAT